MSALARLGEVSREYQLLADSYREVAVASAEAEAAHKSARAQAVLRAKATTSKRMSHAEAETRAEADEVISGLYRDRLVKAALADAHRLKLMQLREQVATGRTAVASEREAERVHTSGWDGSS